MNFRIYSLSDNKLVVQLSPQVLESQIRFLYALKSLVSHLGHPGIKEIMVTFHELTLIFDHSVASYEQLKALMEVEISRCDLKNTQHNGDTRILKLPVCYDDEWALDKNRMTEMTGLPFSDIIALHQRGIYVVYMLGFLPGFLYLGGLDPRLSCPRLSKPRSRIEPGSVGIADAQTGIYPMPSPGGWNIIGRTPVTIFDYNQSDGKEMEISSASLVQPLDRIEFISIDRKQFDQFHGWSILEYQRVHQNMK
ncbi:MAG TPA: 5-oxoprolinase subunit PxpB [Membranihabitans sp.]|nr:5-oxoprolinase subunit PxpB [Membranihabitans sp.]